MRYIKTTNNYVEFIEADDSQNILSVRGFQFGELYFQIKNKKVTFYLNDQENPWRNDVWTINIPFELDGELYEDEDSAAAALEAIINDSFQDQLDELKEDLADEIADRISGDTYLEGLINAETARAEGAESAITAALNNEITRAMSAETILHNEILAEENRALAAESALTDALNDEVARSTAKDAEHDALISGLSTSLQNEINRAIGAENSLRDDLNDEISARTSADAAQLQRITALEVGKADANNVYTKAESDAKYATKEYVSGNTYTKAEITTMLADKADKVNAVSTALYNSQSKTIDLKNIYGNVVASIDARDFIKDGMVDTVSISGNNLVITFNTDAGKENIVVPLTDIFDPTNYYNKTEIDAIVNNIESGVTHDLENYYTKSEVDASQLAQDNKIDAISGDLITLSGEVATISGDALTSGDVQTQIDNSLSGYQKSLTAGRGISITSGATKDTIEFNYSLTGGSGLHSIQENSGHANGMLSHAEGFSTNANGGYSHAEGYQTTANANASHAEGYAAKAGGAYSHAEGYFTETKNDSEHASGQYNVSSKKSSTFGSSGNTLFSVGNGWRDEATSSTTKHNAFEIRQNGDIYITSGGTDILLQDHLGGGGGGGLTPTEVQTMIDNSLSGYQETLSAGTNVQISNNVISATDTTYTAGDGINISNQNVISTVTKFWCGTQAQYDAITTKDSNTVYMIHD